MDIKTWAPFDIDTEWRLFDFPRLARELTGFEFRPSIDVVEEEGELLVTAELPGIDPEDVEVTIDDDVLTIKGEKTEEKDVSEEGRHVHERTFGKFERRIPLPTGVAVDDVTADYDKGVLAIRVMLPQRKGAEPRHIPVNAKA